MARQTVSQDSSIWDYTKDPKHEGFYMGTRVLDPRYGALFVVGDKMVKAKAQISKAFEKIAVGSYVWLEFKGKVDIGGGKEKNIFKIDNDPDMKAPDDKEPF